MVLLLDVVPLPPCPIPNPLVVVVGTAGVVEVVVRVIEVDPMVFNYCSGLTGGGPLHDGIGAVGVTRGAQGSQSSLCVLSGPLISTTAGVWQI
jgi:hypothetical protein